MEILKQGQYQPLPVEKQIVIIFAGTNGYLDDLPVEQCRKFEEELYRFVDNAHRRAAGTRSAPRRRWTTPCAASCSAVIEEFKARFVAEQPAVTAHA